MQNNLLNSKKKLDIYGNPINEFGSWLSPEQIDKCSTILDQAEAAAENNPVYARRVARIRLSLEFTVLQQAKFYGIEKHGIFRKKDNETWIPIPNFKERVQRFVKSCKIAGVTELAEGGLSPDQYMAEWDTILKNGVNPSIVVGSKVSLKYPFSGEYPSKGARTLVDGNPGYKDFSYNWLCFFGTPMEATIELEMPIAFSNIRVDFLGDPRHWFFLPESVTIEISVNGSDFRQVAVLKSPPMDEHYMVEVHQYQAPIKLKKSETVKYIRVIAQPVSSLPDWRYRDNKKPALACDEIFVW